MTSNLLSWTAATFRQGAYFKRKEEKQNLSFLEQARQSNVDSCLPLKYMYSPKVKYTVDSRYFDVNGLS